MFASLRDNGDASFPLVLVATLTCLAVMFWRVALLVLCIAVLTLAAYGLTALD
jgi:hypothetical protein